MKKLYLVDVSSLFFRAFYAIPPLNTAKGLPTNALYGFLTMTIKLLRDIKPEYIAYCFDRKEKSFRFELYPEYKANRGEMPDDLVPQVPYLRKLTQTLGIPLFDKVGFEADDVIGSLAKYGRDNNLEVVIVSGDKDFAQLVGPYVSMYDTMKDKKYDIDGVIEKWGVSPEQMIDYLALVGDSSDNIPGVRGIGPKGAQKLLAEFKDMEGIFANVDKVSGKSTKQKLQDGEDLAYLSKELVTICTDIDFNISPEDLRLKKIDNQELKDLLVELEFGSFEKGLTGQSSGLIQSNNSSPNVNTKSKVQPRKIKARSSTFNVTEMKVVEASANLLDQEVAAYSEVIVFWGEREFLVCCENKIYSVHDELEKVGKILAKKILSWRGFDLKSIWHHLELPEAIQPKADLMLDAYVARAGNVEDFAKVYQTYVGENLPDLPDSRQCIQAYLDLESHLVQSVEEVNGSMILEEIELPLVPILFEMEMQGIHLNVEELEKQSKQLEMELQSLEKEIFKHSGEAFNISSPKQLAHILFEKLNLTPIKKTKTGFSTDSEVLQKLASEHEICDLIINFREFAKLKSTYLDSLPLLVKEDGNIHTSFRQTVTTTGRLSSVNPNLQNIPIRTEQGRMVRKAFEAKPGHLLLSVDYSQIELRVLAHITGDKALCHAFENDLDIHAATASQIFGVKLEEVSSELRRKAKAVNFGIAYGQGAFGLAESLGISRSEASEIIGNYFGRFKSVKEYMETVVEQAKKNGYVETIFGRRRYLPELNSKNGAQRKFGERAAINAPIQGTASDLVKKAMIVVAESVESKLLLQVHDELLLECLIEDVEEEARTVKECMEAVVELQVPLKANVAWGINWEEAHA